MEVIRGLFAAVVLLCAGVTVAHDDEKDGAIYTDICVQVAATIGEDAAKCLGIEDPIVVYTVGVDGIDTGRLLGVYYLGEPYVLVNATRDEFTQFVIMHHEVAHYYHWNLKQVNSRIDFGHCKAEEVAREVTDRMLGTNTNNGWRPTYGCVSDPTTNM